MKEIENLPIGHRIAIYGAGEAGILIKDFILKSRPDLTISCFFDELVNEKIDNIDVHHIKDIQSYKNSFDVIIPASFSNANLMEAILRHYGITNCIRLENITRVVCDAIKPQDFRLNQVKEILSSEKSKELFELIVNTHTDTSKCSELFYYLQNKTDFSKHKQYLDFINPDIVKTAISGGVSDGRTTIQFLEKFKNLKKIYAFEPIYQQFKNEENDTIIKNSGKVEIIEKGLFDKSTNTNIIINGTASRINDYLSSEITVEIKTISINEFVKEKNIEKIDYIKMDIEGAELKALKGAENTIIAHRPCLAICIYHSYNDLFDIPLYLNSILKGYKFEVFHYSLHSNSESVFYAIPDELIKSL